MNLVDLGVLGVVAVSALLGLSRGFVREVLGLGSWLLALYGAWRLGPAVLPAVSAHIDNPDIAYAATYAGLFLVLVIMLSLLANLVGRAVRLSALGGLDRTLGLVFGMLRGTLVVIAGYILLGVVLPHTESWPPALKQARAVPVLYQGAAWFVSLLPEKLRPVVAAPPSPATPTSADLLHATPEGAALGPRPVRN